MRRSIVFLVVAVLFTAPAQAAGGYTFDVRVTDGRSGLLANPDFADMAITAEQFDRAAGSRVVVFDKTTGTHWRWLMLSWFDNDPSIEQRVNDRGAAPPEKADFAFSAGRAGHVRLRCLRDECAFTVTRPDERDSVFTVKRGNQSPDLALPARVSLAFR